MKSLPWIFQNRSLWYKLSLISVAPVLLATIFIGLSIVDSMEKSLMAETGSRVSELTRLSALTISNPSVIYSKHLLDNYVDNLRSEKDILFVMVVDHSDGRILAHSDHVNDGRLAAEITGRARIVSGEPPRTTTAPILINGQPYGEIRVGFSLAGVQAKVARLRHRIGAVSGIAALMGVLFAVFLSRMLSRPIKALARQASAIGAGDYDQRIDYRSGDALGQLVESLNQMASDIRERQELLESEILERRRAEAVQRRYDFIVNAAKDWHTLINRQYAYEAVNDAYCRSLGRDRERIVGRSVADIWGEEVFGGIIKTYLDRCFDGEEINYQAWFDTAPGVSEYYNVTYYPYRERGLDVTHAVVISSDVTRLKRIEEALQLRVREMTALNRLIQHANLSLSVAEVITAALDGTARSVRPDTAMLFLRDGDDLILKGYRSEANPIPTGGHDDHTVGECLCGLAVSQEKPVYTGDIQADPRCSRQECKQAGLRSMAALPLRGRGEIIGVLGLGSAAHREFSEQADFLETMAGEVALAIEKAMLYQQVQEHAAFLEQRVAERTAELEAAMEKAREADQLKSAFLAAMSHELRTPLNSIIGFTGIMLQGLVGPLNEEQTKQLGMVRDSAHHLLSLINDVLDISKIEAGQLEMDPETFDVREAIDRARRTLAPLADKKDLPIEVRTLPDDAAVVGDRRRVEQVLINLLTNGLKFTENGSIRIEGRIAGGMVEIDVADTGIGIRPEDMGKLFKAFQQIDTGLTRRYEGTGLGLSICKKLVEMMGGRIRVDSTWEKGSTFTFTLPRPNDP